MVWSRGRKFLNRKWQSRLHSKGTGLEPTPSGHGMVLTGPVLGPNWTCPALAVRCHGSLVVVGGLGPDHLGRISNVKELSSPSLPMQHNLVWKLSSLDNQ